MTSNQRLKLIITDNDLTPLSVSIMLDVSVHTVNSWIYGQRLMPQMAIKYLELLIKTQ